MNHLNSKSDVTALESIIAGGSAGLVTRFFIAPLDMVKIRLQLQSIPYRPGIAFHTLREIAKHEGIRAFWKGNTPAEMLYVSYGAVQFYSLRLINHSLNTMPMTSDLPESAKQFISGGTAGMASTFVTYPFDYLRTRVAANRSKDKVLKSTIRRIWATHGFTGFYHGLSTSLLSVFPYMGIFFSSYTFFREAMADSANGHWMPQVLSSSALAAIVSKVAIFPIDTIRKRVQAHGVETVDLGTGSKARPHKFMKTGHRIYRKEGLTGLYRGVTISVLKAAPSSFLTVYFYEFFLNGLRKVEPSKPMSNTSS